MRVVVLFISVILLFGGCSKPSKVVYRIFGVVTDSTTDEPVSGVKVTLSGQEISSGTFNANFLFITHTSTNASGSFEICTGRENYNSLKLEIEEDGYFFKETELNPSDIDPQLGIDMTDEIDPISTVNVSLENVFPLDESDRVEFRFVNANFPECFCCDNSIKVLEGESVDSVLSCLIVGNQEIDYLYEVIKAGNSQIFTGSEFVPAFSESTINIDY